LSFETELSAKVIEKARKGGGVTVEVPAGGGVRLKQVLFTGDTLFMSSIGRTDLWGGDFEMIMRSLAGILQRYGDETVIYPGHGPATTIGQERRMNPFLKEL
jgi:glyoxylase-like metal-dependent hydrolase (beta-lactamase superfamily II)